MDITNKQGVTIATDGRYSNLQKVDTGRRGSSGSDQINYQHRVQNEKGTSNDYYLNSNNVYGGTRYHLGNNMNIGNSLENAATGDALTPNSFNNKNLDSKINAYAALGGLSTTNGVQAGGQAVTGGITRYLSKKAGLNKKWESMSQLQQEAAISAYAKAGFEMDGNGAEVKVSTKTAYAHAMKWMNDHPNDTMVDYYKANMQKGFNSIAQMPKSQRKAAFTKFALSSAKGANAIMSKYGVKSGGGISNGKTVGSQPKKKEGLTYKSINQIKPGGVGDVKGSEYYKDRKGSVVDIPD